MTAHSPSLACPAPARASRLRAIPAPPDGSFASDYLAYLLARASHQISRQFHDQLRQMGLAVPTWRVLATLADGSAMSIGELAAVVLLKQPTLTKVIDRMERDGLVRRVGADADRRKVIVAITAAGRRVVGDLIERARAHEAEVLSGYSPAEILQLKSVLKALIRRTGA